MAVVFANANPNLDELINPQTADATQRARLLREKYKMDPEFMKQVDERYGPLEWRLPEAHAIYWAAKGLEAAKANPSKINPEDLITLRRVVYPSLQLSFHRGRLVMNPIEGLFEFGPHLDIVPKVNEAYEQMAEDDAKMRDHILKAHRNFLRDAVYFLYVNNRLDSAGYWFKYLGTKYPDKPILDNKPNSFPRTLTLDEYAVGRVAEDVAETSPDRIKSAVEGMLVNAYRSLAIDDDDGYQGYRNLARQVWTTYMSKIPKERLAAIGLPPFEEIEREIVRRLLDPQEGLPSEYRAVLRTKLRLPAEPKMPAPGTNSPPPKVSTTNSPPSKISTK